MKGPLRLLLVEDSGEDARFLLRELKRDGYEVSSERVETAEETREALEKDDWNAVVSDYFMPAFGALDALRIVRERDPEMPFIIVSGSVGEENAVEAMRAGAHDYVMKDNLARLGPAIEREIREAANRRERRRAEEALREAEERYRGIFENAVDGIFQTSVEGKALAANPAMARILGYGSPEELLESISDVARQLYVEPARREEFDRLMRRQGAVSGFEVELYRKDGGTVWVSIAARALRDAEGGISGFEGIAEDITWRKEAQEALEESEERYRAVVEQSTEGIYLVDAETGRLVEANPSLHEMLGYATGELYGTHLYDLIAHDPKDIDENLGRTLTERRRFVGERKYREKDGSVLDVEVGVSAISYGGKEVVCAIVRDVTERKKTEEALRVSEEQFRASFDQAAVGMAHVSPLGKFLRVNRRLCEMLGYQCEELLEIGFEQVTHPEDLDDDLRHVKRMLEGRIRTYSIEKRYVKKDGLRVWVDLTVSLLRDADGAPRYFISVVQDITERKLAELLPNPLAPQELEALKLVARGLSNREISGELNYSFGATKLHVRRLLKKLGAENRKQAVARAVDIGLIHPEPRQ